MRGHDRISGLNIYTKKFLCQNTNKEGDDCHTDADGRHFQKSGLKWLVLGNGGVVGKAGNDQNNDQEHADQRRNEVCVVKDQIRCDQCDYRKQIGNSGVGTGFQCIVPAFAPLCKEFAGCHGEGSGDTDNQYAIFPFSGFISRSVYFFQIS